MNMADEFLSVPKILHFLERVALKLVPQINILSYVKYFNTFLKKRFSFHSFRLTIYIY